MCVCVCMCACVCVCVFVYIIGLYKCNTCDVAFPFKSKLQQHLTTRRHLSLAAVIEISNNGIEYCENVSCMLHV